MYKRKNIEDLNALNEKLGKENANFKKLQAAQDTAYREIREKLSSTLADLSCFQKNMLQLNKISANRETIQDAINDTRRKHLAEELDAVKVDNEKLHADLKHNGDLLKNLQGELDLSKFELEKRDNFICKMQREGKETLIFFKKQITETVLKLESFQEKANEEGLEEQKRLETTIEEINKKLESKASTIVQLKSVLQKVKAGKEIEERNVEVKKKILNASLTHLEAAIKEREKKMSDMEERIQNIRKEAPSPSGESRFSPDPDENAIVPAPLHQWQTQRESPGSSVDFDFLMNYFPLSPEPRAEPARCTPPPAPKRKVEENVSSVPATGENRIRLRSKKIKN